VLPQAACCEEVAASDLTSLIADLGSEDFLTRKRASEKLKQRDQSAVIALKESACSRDLEVSRRSLAVLHFWLRSGDRALVQAANTALKELESSEDERIRREARFARRDAPENVIRRLEKRGARFKYRNDTVVTGVDLSRQGVSNRDVAALHPFHDVEAIDLDYTEVTSEVLSTFREFSQLRELRLRCGCLQDEHLQSLQPLSKLEILNLWRTGLTDAGVKHLAPLVNLKELNLCHNSITDESLTHLSQMKELTTLNLVQTDITDIGLKHLAVLPKLRLLNVKGTKVTLSGIQQLQTERPDLKIRYCRDQNEACPKRHENHPKPLKPVDSGTSDRFE
jgi:hypothetical protein